MRDKWYSDHRDLVKWSVLILLARQFDAGRIIQIAFLNPSEYGRVEIDGSAHDIPSEVLSHFRNLRAVTTLGDNPPISVFDVPFRNRVDYMCAALSYMASFSKERCVLLLDPDTGLEPNGGGDFKHVLNSEVRRFWEALPSGSVLVFYQHQTNRVGAPWIEEKRRQLADAIGIEANQIKIASGTMIASDVAFFFAAKL